VLAFARRARRSAFDPWLLGRARGHVNRGRALLDAIVLARALRVPLAGHERVAMLFPTSAGGCLAAIAVALSGRTAVWLDPRADAANWKEQATAGHARVVLASGEWLRTRRQTMGKELDVLTLEDLRGARTLASRVAARALLLSAPGRTLQRVCGARTATAPDHVAAVVFAGARAVPLTWGALGSQVAGLSQMLPLAPPDRIACSTGLHSALGQVVLWLTAARGLTLVLPSDDEPGPLGRAITRYAADVLITEPHQLRRFTAACRPGLLGSLRLVLSLGEQHDLAALDAFEAHFGVRPLAGLARADLGPIVSISSAGYRAAGFYQVGSRRGYVGHPLPGVRVKTVAADGSEVPPDTVGELWGAGPGLPGEGWQALGLRGRVDANGYVGLAEEK
jgi:acyl-[acyl-carrier-protein]-phospholipid O-acyltransferase/long-chain-fatty-acid--[acyl-carrier-protein] ligase